MKSEHVTKDGIVVKHHNDYWCTYYLPLEITEALRYFFFPLDDYAEESLVDIGLEAEKLIFGLQERVMSIVQVNVLRHGVNIRIECPFLKDWERIDEQVLSVIRENFGVALELSDVPNPKGIIQAHDKIQHKFDSYPSHLKKPPRS